MLYLSCLPCSDSKECTVTVEAKISAIDSHQKHNHDQEACTPFCTCSCCAITAFYSVYYKTQGVKSFLLTRKYPIYNVAFNTEVYYSIWQPPKIS